jgi:hypothetical protein
MEQTLLSDPNQFPSDEIIFFHIGKAKELWIALFNSIHAEHPDFTEDWRYYRDGKRWLLKVNQKKKTIFWLSIAQDSFRITFYFNDKAEGAIFSSDLSETLKEQYRNGKRFNKIRGLTLTFQNSHDLKTAKVLIGIKLQMK